MKIATCLGCLLLSLLSIQQSNADNINSPMTFRIFHDNPRDRIAPQVFLDGEITSDTPGQFIRFLQAHPTTKVIAGSMVIPADPIIFMTSGGGDLQAGIQLGEIIRRLNLDTWVAAHEPVSHRTQDVLLKGYDIPFQSMTNFEREYGSFLNTYPSYCISACTLAFLGGKQRTFTLGSVYAVHQFRLDCAKTTGSSVECSDPNAAVSWAQLVAAVVLKYLDEMGIPESFYFDLVRADPGHLNALTADQLEKYQICGIGNFRCENHNSH